MSQQHLDYYLFWLIKVKQSRQVRRRENLLTMVVGKDAAHTPSRLSVRSSTPDATTYNILELYQQFHIVKQCKMMAKPTV